jgi:hypothetical protein
MHQEGGCLCNLLSETCITDFDKQFVAVTPSIGFNCTGSGSASGFILRGSE